MRSCIVLVLAVAVLVQANAESVKEKFQRIHSECGEGDAIKPLILCVNIKLGVQKENGDIDKNELRVSLGSLPNFDGALVDSIVAECGEMHGATAAESADALDDCLKRQLSQHMPRDRQ